VLKIERSIIPKEGSWNCHCGGVTMMTDHICLIKVTGIEVTAPRQKAWVKKLFRIKVDARRSICSRRVYNNNKISFRVNVKGRDSYPAFSMWTSILFYGTV